MRGFLLLLLAASICLVRSQKSPTLSASYPHGEDYEEEEEKPRRRSKLAEYAEHDADEETVMDILENHDKLDISEGKLSGIKLAYITPWNNHGYDVAKWAAKKFTHISPVWFKFVPDEIDGQITCTIHGKHDIDSGWMNDILKNNSEIQFVPRFLFEFSQDQGHIHHLLTNPANAQNCAEEMIKVVKEMSADGIVLEIFAQIYQATQGQGANIGSSFISQIATSLRDAGLYTIVPLHPFLINEQSYFPEELVEELFTNADYINLMTYDYNGNLYKGLSPVPWIKSNLDYIQNKHPNHMKKILLGINFYGFCTTQPIRHILGKDLIEFLNEDRDLVYDDEAMEHRVENVDGATCYYPTKLSLSERFKVSQEYELAGIAIWDLGQGLDHFTELL